MKNILQEVLDSYLIQKQSSFATNELTKKLRADFPIQIAKHIPNVERYKVTGSAGQYNNWSDCPWLAVLDRSVTTSPQRGYYPVFLFKANMEGVYLSLNQGVSDVKSEFGKNALDVLRLRAGIYQKVKEIELATKKSHHLTRIELGSRGDLGKGYEAGNIIAKYYSKDRLPSEHELKIDLLEFVRLYDFLFPMEDAFENEIKRNDIEQKKLKKHYSYDRKGGLSEKVKKAKGYTCEACGFNFMKIYGNLGKDFIEAHHKTPISSLEEGKIYRVDLEKDFAVLCSNCHRMIHRLDDSSNVAELKRILRSNNG